MQSSAKKKITIAKDISTETLKKLSASHEEVEYEPKKKKKKNL
jgi:hypothetical protein